MDEYLAPPEPVQPGQAAAAHRPAQAQASLARIGLLGIAAAALIAVAALAFGSTANPANTLAAGSTGTSNQPAVVNDLNGGPGGFGGPGFGHGMGGITVTAISGTSISLATEDGWTRTITVDDGTTYSKSGAAIALGDLKVGDMIGFRETKETDGTFTIDSIVVVLPHLGGEVTAIDGSTITVTDRDGTAQTIKVSGDTTYTVNGNGASLADVQVGMFLEAEGTLNDDGSLAATNVHAGEQGFGGRGPGGDHGFPGPGGIDPNNPDASAAPSATSTAS